MAVLQLVNVIFLIGTIAVFVLFVVVLIKMNKALTIWLRKNGNEYGGRGYDRKSYDEREYIQKDYVEKE